jgi:hypothetical protein
MALRFARILFALLLVATASMAPGAGATQVVRTVAGDGDYGAPTGDGGPAVDATVDEPYAVEPLADGGLLISQPEFNRVRMVDATGEISTVAGTGAAGSGGDGGLATASQLNYPRGLAARSDGSFLIVDTGNLRVRLVDAQGKITTVAGGGSQAAGAPDRLTYTFSNPQNAAWIDSAHFLVSDGCCNQGSPAVYRVGLDDGSIVRVAGNADRQATHSDGDGGPATDARIGNPSGIAPLADGSFYFTEDVGGLRYVGTDGKISTIAHLWGHNLAPAAGGGVTLGYGTKAIRVAADGTITTLAGSAFYGFACDGGLPLRALFSELTDVEPTGTGGLLIADRSNNRVRSIGQGALTAPPSAQLAAPQRALTDTNVTLDARASSEPCTGGIDEYRWDLDGNGSFETSSGLDATVVTSFASASSHSVAVRVINMGGVQDTARRSIDVKPKPPAGLVGVSINDGAQFTNDPDVELSAVWPRFEDTLTVSNDGGFAHAQTRAVDAKVAWRLESSGPERLPKTVYVRFGDSTQTFQDDIILDETAPVVKDADLTPESGAARFLAKTSPRYVLTVKARDKLSGVARMQITRNKKHPGRWRRFHKHTTLRSGHAVWVRVRDRAHNRSHWRRAK